MAKPSRSEQLNRALEALLTGRDSSLPIADAALAPVLRTAAALRDLPRESFKARLKADLQRRTVMASQAVPAPKARKPVKPIPEGFHTVTPYVMVRGAAAFIDFAKHAFGAVEMYRFPAPNSELLMHAAIRIGDSIVELADATPEHPATGIALHLYVENTDELYRRAIAAGATSIEPPADKPYGDRSAGVRDAFGNQWFIATHIRDMKFEDGKMSEATDEEPKATARTNWIRKGFHTITPYITVNQAPELIDFIKHVFGAEELFRDIGSAGGYHCEMKLGDSMLMIGGGLNLRGTPMPTNLWTYVSDVDETYKRALSGGAASEMAPSQMDYGERGAAVKDLAGNNWYIATYNQAGATTFVREGLHTVTPYLHPQGAAGLIEFLKEGFGGEELYVGKEPNGRISHAQIRVGDSVIALSDALDPSQARPAIFYLYVEDADALYNRAMQAGATSIWEPKDQPYGDRVGGVKDAFGNQWFIATHTQGAIA